MTLQQLQQLKRGQTIEHRTATDKTGQPVRFRITDQPRQDRHGLWCVRMSNGPHGEQMLHEKNCEQFREVE